MREGVARLLIGELRRELRYLEKNLPDLQRLCLMFSTLGSAEQLLDDLWLAAIAAAFLEEAPLPRDAAAFQALVAVGRERFIPCATRLARQVFEILDLYTQIRRLLAQELPLSWVEAARDIERQLAGLVYPGFLRATPPRWRERLPRYLRAILNRIDKLDGAPDRDRLRRAEIEPLCERLRTAPAALRECAALTDYRWLLEELRVSLFTQELGAIEKVSVKRLDKLWVSLHQ
jgi:ATP-dependent helicase HrpA